MVGGSRIAAIGAAGEGPIAADSNDTNAAPVPPLVLDSHWDDEPGPDDAEPAASGASRAWLMPALAEATAVSWVVRILMYSLIWWSVMWRPGKC